MKKLVITLAILNVILVVFLAIQLFNPGWKVRHIFTLHQVVEIKTGDTKDELKIPEELNSIISTIDKHAAQMQKLRDEGELSEKEIKALENKFQDKLNKDIYTRLDKMQKSLDEIRDTLNKQTLFITKNKEDDIADSARIINMEKQLLAVSNNVQALLADRQKAPDPNPADKNATLSASSANTTAGTELLKDIKFSEELNKKVGEAMKSQQKKQLEIQLKSIETQLKGLINKYTLDFSDKYLLTEVQRIDVYNALSGYAAKLMELYTKINEGSINAASFISQRDTYRVLIKEQLKQSLLPDQHTPYLKAEPGWSKTMMGVLNQNTLPAQ